MRCQQLTCALLAVLVAVLVGSSFGLRYTVRDRLGALLESHAEVSEFIRVDATTVGLEWEIGCLKIAKTKSTHTNERPAFDEGMAHLFSSAEKDKLGTGLVQVTRDMHSASTIGSGNKEGELEIVTGPFVYNDAEARTKVVDFLNNFFQSVKKVLSSDKVVNWGENEVVSVNDVYEEMKKSEKGKPADAKEFDSKTFFIKKSGLCQASPQVNFGFKLENYVSAKDALETKYSADALKAYQKCTSGIAAFLDAAPTLKAHKDDPTVQSVFCLLAEIGNMVTNFLVSKNLGSSVSNLDVKDVNYKNAYNLLPKFLVGDVVRCDDAAKPKFFTYFEDIKGVKVTVEADRFAAAFCMKYETNKETCQGIFKDIILNAFGKKPDYYKDTPTAYGSVQEKLDKKIFSAAPKPVPIMYIGGKCAFLFESRGTDQALAVANTGDMTSWKVQLNLGGLDGWGALGTTGAGEKVAQVPVPKQQKGGIPSPPPPPGPPPPPPPSSGPPKPKKKQQQESKPKPKQQETPKKDK